MFASLLCSRTTVSLSESESDVFSLSLSRPLRWSIRSLMHVVMSRHRYYVEKAFKGDSKEYAEDIIVATIQAFKDRLPELDWLDPETRKKAEEKADAITHKVRRNLSSFHVDCSVRSILLTPSSSFIFADRLPHHPQHNRRFVSRTILLSQPPHHQNRLLR